MKFSPFNIKNQEFNKSVRGFDRDEVRAFLEKLSDEVERLQSENDTLKKELESTKGQIDEFKKIEKNLQATLLSATESSSRAVESAKKQTALMLKEADLKATQIVEKAKEDADRIRDSVLKLREEKALLVARLKAMIDSQASLLELNVERERSHTAAPREIKSPKESDINVDDILEKLL